jgi:hypothetical protein
MAMAAMSRPPFETAAQPFDRHDIVLISPHLLASEIM